MNSIIVREKKKFFPFSIKKEIHERFVVFKIYDEHKITAKRLIKKLAKERIVNIAFDNNISYNFSELFKGQINIITKNDVLFGNIEKIVLKISNMLGIKEGKLSLGIIPGYKTDVLIKKLEEIRNKLKVLYFFL